MFKESALQNFNLRAVELLEKLTIRETEPNEIQILSGSIAETPISDISGQIESELGLISHSFNTYSSDNVDIFYSNNPNPNP